MLAADTKSFYSRWTITQAGFVNRLVVHARSLLSSVAVKRPVAVHRPEVLGARERRQVENALAQWIQRETEGDQV